MWQIAWLDIWLILLAYASANLLCEASINPLLTKITWPIRWLVFLKETPRYRKKVKLKAKQYKPQTSWWFPSFIYSHCFRTTAHAFYCDTFLPHSAIFKSFAITSAFASGLSKRIWKHLRRNMHTELITVQILFLFCFCFHFIFQGLQTPTLQTLSFLTVLSVATATTQWCKHRRWPWL